MKTYYCDQCGAEKKLKSSEYRRTNEKAWCYHNPNVPLFMAPVSFKKMPDYGKLMKAITQPT